MTDIEITDLSMGLARTFEMTYSMAKVRQDISQKELTKFPESCLI